MSTQQLGREDSARFEMQCRDTNKRPSQMRLESNPALSALFLFIKSFIFHHIYLVLQRVTFPPPPRRIFSTQALVSEIHLSFCSILLFSGFVLQTVSAAKSGAEKSQEVASKEPHASSGVDYVKKWGQTHSMAQLYMDCKIKVSLNIQHAVQ